MKMGCRKPSGHYSSVPVEVQAIIVAFVM